MKTSSIPWICFWAASFVLLVHSRELHAAKPTDAQHPNVLFIAIDDLACSLGCYGDIVAQTPNIDRLAKQGIVFQRAYNQIPLCNPTRASIMTGMRPDEIQVYDLDRHFRESVPEVATLPQWFQQHDYFTARVGKIYHYNVPAGIGTDGLDDLPSWQLRSNPKGRDTDEENLIYNAEPHRPVSAALSWLAAGGDDEEQTDGMIASSAITIMEDHKHHPFFLGVGFFRPHTPYVAPQKYFDLYSRNTFLLPYAPANDRDDIPVAAFAHNCPVPNYGLPHEDLIGAMHAYYACVSFVDAQVGRLLDALDRLEIADNTIVVLWSDHGYHLGEHGGIWQKRTLFEQASRAPLIIRPADGDFASGSCEEIVEFLDIYPTIVDLAELPMPDHVSGKSLRPLLKDPYSGELGGFAITQILRPADDRLAEPVMGCSIRTSRFRYTEWGEGEYGIELYDHQSDPLEFNNLASDPDPQVKAWMRELQSELRRHASGSTPKTPFNPQRL